jgi:hypothetical protein
VTRRHSKPLDKATEDRLRRAQPPSALLSRSQYVPDCTVKVVVLLDILIEAQSNKLSSGRAYERRHAPSHQCRLRGFLLDDKTTPDRFATPMR